LTDIRTYGTPSRMPRQKLFPIRLTLPLTREMLAQADAALAEGEDRVSFIRHAIEREIKRRTRKT
jgi:hypothetical protein